MKKTQVLTTLKLVVAAVLVVISLLLILDKNPAKGFASNARAADPACGNKYTDSSLCTNPPASIECTVTCDANGQNPKSNCTSDRCPKPPSGGTDICNEYWRPEACPDGQMKLIKTHCDVGSCPGGGQPGANCYDLAGGCEPHGTGGGPGGTGPTPAQGDYVAPTIPPDAPPNTNCKVTESGQCGHAEFYGYTPGAGKMACCSGTAVGQYGTATDCASTTTCSSNGQSICDQHQEGGVWIDPSCGNPVNCPVNVQPTIAGPTPCPQIPKTETYCQTDQTKASYCHAMRPFYNGCTGQDIYYEDTGVGCCNNEPTPPVPTQKPPSSTTVCDGLEVVYTDPAGAQQTALSNDFNRVIEVLPGSDVTFKRLHLSNRQYENGFGWSTDVSCFLTSPATCTVDSLVAAERAAGYPKPLPYTLKSSTDSTLTGQTNGVRTVAETYTDGGGCSVRIKAKALTPGTCTALNVSLEKGGSVAVTSATANNVLPRVPDPGEKITVSSTAGASSQFVIYAMRPYNAPDGWDAASNAYSHVSSCSYYILNPDSVPPSPDGTYTMPDWKAGTLRRNDSWGQTACQDVPLNFDSGIVIVPMYIQAGVAYGDAHWCKNNGPATTSGVMHVGSTKLSQSCENICVAAAVPPGPTTPPTGVPPTKTPQQAVCGKTCDDVTAPCGTGYTCITATAGGKYCAQVGLEAACKETPTETACCSVPSPTPTTIPSPTPTPPSCGDTPCDEVSNKCANGQTCILANNGKKYCAMNALTEKCGKNPSQTNCCTETTPTPIPSKTPVPLKCGETCNLDNGQDCGNGMTCIAADNGKYICGMDKYQSACTQYGNFNNCCKAPTVVQCGQACGDTENNTICQTGYTCTEFGSGKVCAKDSLMQKCTEASTNNAKTDCCTEVTPTPVPSYTPYPTYTPLPPPPTLIAQQVQQVQYVQQVQPTYTPVPPPPTYTIIPTYSPFPTQPPQATYTPVPPPPVSGSPLPFVVAGVPIILLILGMLL